ncbi:hypothetical protein [Paenibacillus sp. HW567]|nr:hypothetical protein [Paenibacillus sp. HW567]
MKRKLALLLAAGSLLLALEAPALVLDTASTQSVFEPLTHGVGAE